MNIEINNDVLYCPYCNSENLRQMLVEVNWRVCEDGDGEKIISSNGATHIYQVSNLNIPGRRHYISILFDCENCQKTPVLGIVQHKGSTQVRWEDGTE